MSVPDNKKTGITGKQICITTIPKQNMSLGKWLGIHPSLAADDFLARERG